MNEKITIQDLTDLLAARHHMTKEDAEAFVKDFFLLIEEALENEEAVTVKGLGTFKPVDAEGHTGMKKRSKVRFVPDTDLKNTINKPFAHFEAVALNENTVLKDTPEEEGQPEEATDTGTGEEAPSDAEAVGEEPAGESDRTTADPASPQPEPDKQDTEKEEPEDAGQPEPEKERKSPVPYLIAVICIVVLLCGGLVLFLYYPDLFHSSANEEEPPATVQVDGTETNDTTGDDNAVAGTDPENGTATEKRSPVVKQTGRTQPGLSKTNYSDAVSYRITGTKDKYTIKKGDSLAKISERFYGTKALWTYIVKYNKDVIKNPDAIPYGTQIKIPELTAE